MKKNDLKDLKTKKAEDLIKMVSQKKAELAKLMAGRGSKAEKNVKKAKNLRKDIARILTIVTEMKIIEKINQDKKEETK